MVGTAGQLAEMPSVRAARQAAMVAPADRRERSAIASLHGKPISRMACGSTLPSLMAGNPLRGVGQRHVAFAGARRLERLHRGKMLQEPLAQQRVLPHRKPVPAGQSQHEVA